MGIDSIIVYIYYDMTSFNSAALLLVNDLLISLRVRLVWWKESERKENYGNRWMNLDDKVNQIHLLICVIFLPLTFSP
jgi:hypothetical protein